MAIYSSDGESLIMIDKKKRNELLALYSTNSHSFKDRMHAYLKISILPLKVFSDLIPKEGKILDFGAGYGYLANYLALNFLNSKVVGLDISEKRINFAKKTINNRTNIEFHFGEFAKLDNLTNFDVITMTDVLHHIPRKDHLTYLKLINKRLNENGHFLIRETNKNFSLKYFLMNYLNEKLFYFYTEHGHFYSANDLKKLLKDAGFEIDKEIFNDTKFYDTVIYDCKKGPII